MTLRLNELFLLTYLTVFFLIMTTHPVSANMKVPHRFFVPVKSGTGLWGLVDDNGQLIAPPIYTFISSFDENNQYPVNVQNIDGKWGYLSADGVVVHKLNLDQAYGFSDDGFARFENQKKWGFIRPDGSYLVDPVYDDATYFSNGYAAVKQGEFWFHIDQQGERISDKSYLYVGEFGKTGLAAAVNNGETKGGFIDTQGNWAIKPQFDSIETFFDSGSVLVKKNGLWGVIDSHGKWLLKPTYTSVKSVDEKGFAIVTRDDYISGGIINDRGELIIDTGEKRVGWLELVSQCNIAYFFDHYSGKTTFFNLDDGAKIKSLGKNPTGLTSSFNRDCVALAVTKDESRWMRQHSNGDQFYFDDNVLEPLFDKSTEPTSYAHETGYFSPVLTKDRSLAYIDYQGSVALNTEILKQESHDVFIIKDRSDKVLWQHKYEPNTLRKNKKHLAFLNLGDAELGYQKPDQERLKAQLKQLQESEPFSFDATTPGLIEDHGDGFGTGIQLAQASYTYTDHTGYYYSIYDRANLNSRFYEYKASLMSILGDPIEKNDAIEAVFDDNGLYSYKDAVWKLGSNYLVLHDSYYEDGDVSYFAILNLLLLPTAESRRAKNDLPLLAFADVNLTATSSDRVIDALDKMEREMIHSTAINLRASVLAVLKLLESGEQITSNDYVRTQHALIHAAYYDAAQELQIGTVDQYVAVSENTMRFIEQQGLEDDLLTAEVQFRRETYRRSANGAAWLLHEVDPDRALTIIEPALPYINDRDSFLYDTYARALLEAGKSDEAYALIKETFDENPWYSYFQEFYTDDDYLAWLKKNGHKTPEFDEAPSTSNSVFEEQKIAVHAAANLLAVYWFDQIYLFDLLTGKLLHEFDAKTYAPFTFKFNTDGSQLISSGWDTTYIWDTHNGKKLKKQRVYDGNSEHAGVSDNQTYFYYDNEDSFQVDAIKSGRTKVTISDVVNANSSRDEKFIATAFSDDDGVDHIAIIDLNQAKQIATLKGEQASPYDNDMFFVNQNSQLLVRDNSDFYLWNIASRKVERSWDTDNFDVNEVAVLDEQVIIIDGDAFEKRTWTFTEKPGESTPLPIPSMPDAKILSISVSANQQFYSLAVQNAEQNLIHVFVIEMKSDKLLSHYISENIANDVYFANDDKYLVLNAYPIEVIDWKNNTKVYVFSRSNL